MTILNLDLLVNYLTQDDEELGKWHWGEREKKAKTNGDLRLKIDRSWLFHLIRIFDKDSWRPFKPTCNVRWSLDLILIESFHNYIVNTFKTISDTGDD